MGLIYFFPCYAFKKSYYSYALQMRKLSLSQVKKLAWCLKMAQLRLIDWTSFLSTTPWLLLNSLLFYVLFIFIKGCGQENFPIIMYEVSLIQVRRMKSWEYFLREKEEKGRKKFRLGIICQGLFIIKSQWILHGCFIKYRVNLKIYRDSLKEKSCVIGLEKSTHMNTVCFCIFGFFYLILVCQIQYN